MQYVVNSAVVYTEINKNYGIRLRFQAVHSTLETICTVCSVNECIQIMVNEGIQQIIVNIIVVFRLI